ncbi:small acidic protein-like [Tubulanus polymorphus]|uniref:small acidic protein-like n=1 Tax=Tubulanus polymorphus TaxID=672921 RepID=UPI003DA464C7
MSDGSTNRAAAETSAERGEKRPVDEDVHSANQWESVDLGDNDRKNKFLRLMGASKKEHHGRFVIGDSHRDHTKAGGNVDEKDIEKEFEKGIDYKLSSGYKQHKGLGFHEELDAEKEKTADAKAGCSEEKSTEDASKSDTNDKKEDTNGQKPIVSETKNSEKTTEKSTDESSKQQGIKKMTFVKASS